MRLSAWRSASSAFCCSISWSRIWYCLRLARKRRLDGADESPRRRRPIQRVTLLSVSSARTAGGELIRSRVSSKIGQIRPRRLLLDLGHERLQRRVVQGCVGQDDCARSVLQLIGDAPKPTADDAFDTFLAEQLACDLAVAPGRRGHEHTKLVVVRRSDHHREVTRSLRRLQARRLRPGLPSVRRGAGSADRSDECLLRRTRSGEWPLRAHRSASSAPRWPS